MVDYPLATEWLQVMTKGICRIIPLEKYDYSIVVPVVPEDTDDSIRV